MRRASRRSACRIATISCRRSRNGTPRRNGRSATTPENREGHDLLTGARNEITSNAVCSVAGDWNHRGRGTGAGTSKGHLSGDGQPVPGDQTGGSRGFLRTGSDTAVQPARGGEHDGRERLSSAQ